MRYELKNCPICGSEDLVAIDKKFIDLDTYVVYKCKACDEVIKATNPNNQAKVIKKAEKKDNLSAVEIYNNSIKSVVIVKSDIDEERKVCGTGFAISSNGYIITNAHVITNVSNENDEQLQFAINENITITNSEGNTFDCDLINVDLKRDLAILKTCEDVKFNVLCFGKYEEVKTGEKILAIGNSKGEGLSIIEGLVSDRERKVGSTTKILISVPLNHGNSGGPLINYRNEIIGVTSSGKKDAVAMNYAVPVDDVLDFIAKTEQNEGVTIL